MGATMKDIAKKLDISINAVSLALNDKPGVSDELKIEILRTADELGYLQKRARYLRTFQQTNLCVMMRQIYATDLNFYGRVLFSVTEETRKAGYDTIMHFFKDGAMELPLCITEHRVSGVIVIGKISDENIKTLQDYNIPIVLVDHASFVYTTNSVLIDNKQGGYLATQHLLAKGYKNIGFFGDLEYSLSIKERFFGFQQAMLASGMKQSTLNEYITRYSLTKDIEQAILKNDNQKILQLVKTRQELPQAFVCSNDFAAIALMESLKTMGYRVPEDVAIIGFDNIAMAEKVIPKLTTIHVDKEKMGKSAVQRIRQILNTNNEEIETLLINVELIQRDSVAELT